MKKLHLLLVAALLMGVAQVTRAQSLITSTVTKIPSSPNFSRGRDFWFVEMSNDWGVNEGDKYLRIYISSPSSTTAYVSAEGKTTPITITPNQVGTYLLPEFTEMESSGQVESKAIHVWSNDADLVVYTMSHQNASTDGSHILPTIGWGTDYVVASYESLFSESGAFGVDLPGTMAVVADEDNSLVSITPTCDCRQCWTGNYSGDANSTNVSYPAGQTALFTLKAGQCVELMPIKTTGFTGFDLSGTIVHATHPVGVFGGAMETQIPSQSAYSDHIEEMIPPVRSWATTYYTTSFHQADSLPLHDSAMYLLAASKSGQKIYRSTCGSDTDSIALANQYDIAWMEAYKAGKFWSNAPFLCVEYSNGSTYPDGLQGMGDPSEAVVIPRSQFIKTVQFVTPTLGDSFYNYANVVLNINDEKKTFIDAKPITNFKSQCLDSAWEVFVVDSLSSGSHTVTGDDSSVSVLVYGYGTDDTYSWGSQGLSSTFRPLDTVAPVVRFDGECYVGEVVIEDSGIFPPNDTQSGISGIVLDSMYNMTYSPQLVPPFITGSDVQGSSYGMYVNNLYKPALLRIDIFDEAGNETIVTSTYTPAMDTFVPPLQNLGVDINPPGTPVNIAYDTIYNYGDSIFDIDILELLKGNVGFTLHDSVGGPVDLSPMPPHSRRLIEIQFVSVQSTPVIDSIHFGNACHVMSVAVIGSGGSNDFVVTSQTWADERLPVPVGGYIKTVEVVSLSSGPIMILHPFWADQKHFRIAIDSNSNSPNYLDSLTTFPFTLPPSPAKIPISIAYFPDSGSLLHKDTTQGTWTSPDIVNANHTPDPRFDLLTGWAAPYVDAVPAQNGNNSTPLVWSLDGSHISVTLPEGWEPPARFELVNLLGETVYSGTVSGTQRLSTGSLPRGIYFWHLATSHAATFGKM
ncbi:MAG TPA: IgGFc-binding protein, partial [Candidatus Kapabacteria bacterium]